jgi:hypothetical protein
MKKLTLTLEVEFDEHNTSVEDLKEMLLQIPAHAAGNGLFTQNTDAEVVTWNVDVQENKY